MGSRTGMLNHNNYATEDNGSQRDKMMEVDLVNTDSEKRGAENIAKNVENEAPACSVDVESGPNTLRMDRSEDLARKTSHENVPTQVASEVMFRIIYPQSVVSLNCFYLCNWSIKNLVDLIVH